MNTFTRPNQALKNGDGFGHVLQDYQTALDWLLGLMTDRQGSRYFENRTRRQRLDIYRRRLRRVFDFLDHAGQPQEHFRSIHIAGTSGKGSVVSLIAAILSAAGAHTGCHTSPYLEVPNEKLCLDGQMIAPSEFTALVNRLRVLVTGYRTAGRAFKSIRYSDAWAALICLWFAQEKVDWAVVETGMGGRYDATNVLPSSLAVITNINYDHIAELGPALPDIAWHKAGIIKPGQPAIMGLSEAENPPEVLAIFRKEATRKGAPLFEYGKDYTYTVHQVDEHGIRLSVQTSRQAYPDLFVPLQGAFQAPNTALAVAALDLLAQYHPLPLSPALVRSALAGHTFPGRMEVVQPKPLVLLDGAHNPHKMRALAESLKTIYPGRATTAVFGALAMKDAEGLLAELLPVVQRVIYTRPHVLGKPSFQTDGLLALTRRLAPGVQVEVIEDVQKAVDSAIHGLPANGMVVVTGSIYMVGEARERWASKTSLLRQAEEAHGI